MPSILVIDDSPIDLKLASSLLEKQSQWSVTTASTGMEAVEILAQTHFDLIVTDLQMPEMDGLQLVNHVIENHPQIPVVLMTAQGSEEIAVQALGKGAASYVPKRLLSKELVKTAQRVMHRAQEERTLLELQRSQQKLISHYVLENDTALLMSVTNILENSLSGMWGLKPTQRMQMRTALEEAMLNALHHGNLELDSELRQADYDIYYQLAEQRVNQPPYAERKIRVSVELTQTEATFVIEDEGPGFQPESVPDPTNPEFVERPFGRGMLLMRTFMDEVTYNEKGNQVTLYKKRA